MIKSFLVKVAFLATLVLPLIASHAEAQTGQRVAVSPFRLFGVTGAQLEQLSNLSRGLLDITINSLTNQGFVPVAMGTQTLNMSDQAIAAQARALGADYLLTPSLTKSGNAFNLSGQLLALAQGLQGSSTMTTAANAPEALPQAAERLVLMTTDHLFGGGARVVSVEISGSAIVDNQAVLNSLRIRQGGTYNESKAASDIRRLYSMGYFENVSVETSDVSGGKAVRFIVTERPQIGAIVFQGNSKYDDEDLLEQVGVKLLDVASDDLLATAVSNLTRFYNDKGYPLAVVSYELTPGDEGRTRLTFNVNEGGKMYIRDIFFDGNDFYSDRKLRGQMESSRYKFLTSWLTGAGKLDREKLANDSQVLEQYYANNGFLQARVGEPDVSVAEDGEGFSVTFPIYEGPRFMVGNVTLTGDLLEDDDPEKMLRMVDLRDEKWFAREQLQEDLNSIRTYYADKGYAHNSVEAEFGNVDEEGRLDVQIVVLPRNKVYYNRITIVGNERTRDKVIRRHLEVAEGDLTTSSKLINSKNNLMRSGFFEDINILQSPSDDPEMMDMRVEVKERPTGSFQIGAGYSNYNGVFGVMRVTQDNLFGYGRRIGVEANIGSGSNYFDFSFTDPWVGDIPLMMGINVFKYYNDYDYYRKDSFGVSLRAGYPVFERFYLTGTYSWEDVDITDIGYSYSQYLRSFMGTSVNSTFTLALRRDTRNHFFQPTAGSTARVSYTIASGLFGGDTYFNRYEAEYAHWIPIPFLRGWALMGHAEVGYAKESRPRGLPIYEKYMLGGINSIRGYDWYDVSPKDPVSGENIGGEKMMVMNFELTMPLIADSGLYGVFFYDMGNVWSKDDRVKLSMSNLKKSYGAGLRYLSPMGPLRIEYGKALDPDPGDPSGRWEFTMGAMF
ncbi:MAG: outer membrane protein assembly factor BamA [Deltaproteobacteria bacterium]|jgi:outer membrane protein insertion porin family|nr:outer membrane protein assembly factor BamA [Deltaproteobacteria bacterium]